MEKTLAILEVSQKQAYIFGSKFLKENQLRSRAIRLATEELWKECLPGDLTEKEKERRLVYAGGGHIILQFDDKDEAKETVKRITRAAYTRYVGMEMFAKLMVYDEAQTPGENLNALLKALEAKKSLRASAFRRISTGLEKLDPVTFQPMDLELVKNTLRPVEPKQVRKLELPPERHPLLPEEGELRIHQKVFEELAGSDNFIAVVHIDGNNMGAKSQQVTKNAGDDWDACCAKHRAFSESVDLAFRTALKRTIEMVEERQSSGELELLNFRDEQIAHPVRPVVAAGDDICFVTSGKLGIECAVWFLRALQNPNAPQYRRYWDEAGELAPYSACAGVAMVHTKYPFHRAYELSEELCSSAKRYAAELAAELVAKLGEKQSETERERISTIDWHIEFGQGRGSVSETRKDYLTEDSEDGRDEQHPIRSLTLRPLAVIGGKEDSFRSYDFFRKLFDAIDSGLSEHSRDKISRGKLKGIRVPLKQGEWETRLYIRENGLNEFEKWAWDQVTSHAQIAKQAKRTQESFTPTEREGKEWHCRSLYFDAVELVDHLLVLNREEGAK